MIIQTIILVFAIVLIVFLVFWRFYFLRNPERYSPRGRNIVAPADGKIIKIMPISKKKISIKKGLMGKIKTLVKDTVENGYLISIFMSVLDVHINRAPVQGTVLSTKHRKGKFLIANNLKALENEKNEIIIKNDKLGKIKVILIAGFLARRIICNVKENQKVIKGQRIGLINLGSQVTLILPKSIRLQIKEGQKVRAGETILATY